MFRRGPLLRLLRRERAPDVQVRELRAGSVLLADPPSTRVCSALRQYWPSMINWKLPSSNLELHWRILVRAALQQSQTSAALRRGAACSGTFGAGGWCGAADPLLRCNTGPRAMPSPDRRGLSARTIMRSLASRGSPRLVMQPPGAPPRGPAGESDSSGRGGGCSRLERGSVAQTCPRSARADLPRQQCPIVAGGPSHCVRASAHPENKLDSWPPAPSPETILAMVIGRPLSPQASWRRRRNNV